MSKNSPGKRGMFPGREGSVKSSGVVSEHSTPKGLLVVEDEGNIELMFGDKSDKRPG